MTYPAVSDGVTIIGAESVQWIQKTLNALGASPRLVEDGAMGPKTRAALAAFQKSKGLAATGEANEATVAAMKSASPQTLPLAMNATNGKMTWLKWAVVGLASAFAGLTLFAAA